MKDIVAASPPIAVAGMKFLGYPITEWAALFSIIWVLILMVLKVIELTNKDSCSKCGQTGK